MVTFLSHFTPSMMSEDVIERIFVQREDLASRLVTLVRESVLGTAKHHTLIVGPRGIGKTHLASLVYHRVRGMSDLTDKMRIAWLREEEWGIASFLDFVIRVLRAFDEEYPEAGLADRIEGLFAHKAEEAERTAVALLDEFVGERTVFLITENLDQLFEGLNDVGQQQFRAYLQDRATWTILATAPGLFNGISLQSSPFYGFFRVRHLKELSVDEAVELLQKIAALGGRDELASFVRTPVGRARIRAVHHLAGGNHRIYVIFSEFLTRETLDELVDPFLTTMDHLTPYYQARMQSLSPQMRKIVDYLCDVRHAVPVKEIAQRCFISQQTASAQLKLLKERGFVRAFNVGRESHYELMEPLLRLSMEVKKQRGEPIRFFIDFLRFWYTKPELEQRLRNTGLTQSIDGDYLRRALDEWTTAPTIGGLDLQEWETNYIRCVSNDDFDGALEYAESLVRMRGDYLDYLRKGICFVQIGNESEATTCAQVAIDLAPKEPDPVFLLAIAEHRAGHLETALTALERMAALDGLPAVGWNLRGRVLQELERDHEGIEALRTAVDLEPSNPTFRVHLVSGLRMLGRDDEALRAANEAPSASISPSLLEEKGLALEGLDRTEEAIASLAAATDAEETGERWAQLARLLLRQGRLREAEAAVRRATELDPQGFSVLLASSAIYQVQGRSDAAIHSVQTATSLYPDIPEGTALLGLLLERAGRVGEALSVYRECLARNPDLKELRLRVVTALAGSHEWESALLDLGEALRHDGAQVDDHNISEELLSAWLLHRPSTYWDRELEKIAEAYAGAQLLPALSVSIAKSLATLISSGVDLGTARHWIQAWTALAESHAELKVGVKLLRAGMDYYTSEDPRYLLELVSEERAMVESIPGIGSLSELT